MSWQPIETAPKDGTVVLIHDPDDAPYTGIVTIGLFDGEKWNGCDHGYHMNAGIIVAPTHWMPLPSPPGTVEEGGVE